MALIPKGSYSVMNQRSESANSLDDFPTPQWATRALYRKVLDFEKMGGNCVNPKDTTIFEPTCNRGYMVRPLQEYFGTVIASDVFDYGCGFEVNDFLFDFYNFSKVDWVITNPPFNHAEEFIAKSLTISRHGCAMLLRSNFAETVGRYNRLFSKNPPSTIAQFSERVPMVKGRIDKKASTATAYAWFVWQPYRVENDTKFIWIPPCRKELEKDSDYASN